MFAVVVDGAEVIDTEGCWLSTGGSEEEGEWRLEVDDADAVVVVGDAISVL